jgi:SOS-response transcriptional repressor LexA
MTPAQSRLLTFVCDYTDQTSASPSFAEMKEALGFSSNARVHAIMGNLVRDGWIAYSGVRNIQILKRPLWLSPYGLPALERLPAADLKALAVRIVLLQSSRRVSA